MYKRMNSEIQIGDYIIEGGLHSCKIESSRKNLTTTAELLLPNFEGILGQDIKVNDAVRIKLGYDKELFTEFEGYVVQIEPNHPFRLLCEDEMFQLKNKKQEIKSWKETTLTQVLQSLVKGISTSSIPDISLESYRTTPDASVAEILEKLKDEYKLDIFYQNNKLFAGYAYNRVLGNVEYHLQKNVPSNQSRLKSKRKGEKPFGVKGLSKQKDGKEIEFKMGDQNGEQVRIDIPGLTLSQLTDRVEHVYKSLDYTGYEGQIVGFGQPFAQHGMTALIYTDKQGDIPVECTIEAVTVKYDSSGFRREVELGYKN